MQILILMSHEVPYVLASLRIFYAGSTLQHNCADFWSELPLPKIRRAFLTQNLAGQNILCAQIIYSVSGLQTQSLYSKLLLSIPNFKLIFFLRTKHSEHSQVAWWLLTDNNTPTPCLFSSKMCDICDIPGISSLKLFRSISKSVYFF